jgi:hypothetical protein
LASAIPYRNINWLRNLKTVGPQGKIDGHLIAALFDDVSTSQGQISDSIASLTTAQAALAAAIKALQTPAPAPTTPSGSTTTGPANEVLATPDGTGGLATIRALVAADIPNLPESKITNLVSDLALKAPLASPALTGSPTAPTQTPLDNSTKLATTAYADLAVGVEKTRALAAEALLAPLASPALTGTPTAPTPALGTNTTQIATMAALGRSLIAVLNPSGTGVASFTSIAATFRHLFLTVYGASSVAATFSEYDVTLNGDTGNNYDAIDISFNNGTSTSGAGAAIARIFCGWVPGATGPANSASGGDIRIFNYANTTFQKVVEAAGHVKLSTVVSGLWITRNNGWWRNTAAINRVDVTLNAGNWVAGSQICLYGEK